MWYGITGGLWKKSLCTLVILGLCAAARHRVAAAVKPAVGVMMGNQKFSRSISPHRRVV
jgi:hypothetical protein